MPFVCVGAQWQYGGLLWSMTGVPPYLSAMRSAGLAVVCARMTGASFQQVSSSAILCHPHAFSLEVVILIRSSM